MPFHDLICVAHVHSSFSDGTATVPEIVQDVRQAGADALLLTDHDTRDAARHGHERWHGDVLVLVGHEVTTSGGHLLALDVEDEIAHTGLTEAEICTELQRRGGFGFAAHPFSRGGFHPAIVRPHPWTTLADCQNVGVELWSLTTDEAESWRTPAAAWRFLRDPEGGLKGPPQRHLDEWDRLCTTRRVPAIGGLDAHQPGVRIGGRVRSPMPHARYFAMLRTHILLEHEPAGELEPDRAAVYAALREGRCYLAVDAIAPARGFTFEARSGNGRKQVAMGEEVVLQPLTLHVTLPQPGAIRLLCNGRTVAHADASEIQHAISAPGAYRVEVRLHWRSQDRPWILSNPIYVRDPAATIG